MQRNFKTEKIVSHPVFGSVALIKVPGGRRLKIVVDREGNVRLSVPYLCTYGAALDFLNSNVERVLKLKESVLQRVAARKAVPSIIYTGEALAAFRKEAKKRLPEMLKECSEYLNTHFKITLSGIPAESPFSYSRVAIKNNRSNWGSCSALKNINLNMHLLSLPEHLCRHVILHELVHLVYPNHGKNFHALLDRASVLLIGNGEKELRKELSGYTLR